jgi:glycosyltransferase involved in cell wall biosynthesis
VENKSLPERQAAGDCTVAIVVNTYDQVHYLGDALQSCMRQTIRPSELLLVDDGSHDNPEHVVRQFPEFQIYRQENAGLSAARNAGLARISSKFIIFLDADDRLAPVAVKAGLDCFARNPNAWLVYGAYRVIDAAGQPASSVTHERLGSQPFLDLLRRGNVIAMHAAVMYRTDCLRSIAGFDDNLRVCEDFDVYLRIARVGSLATHDYCVAEYRHHEYNVSRDKRVMLEVACSIVRARAADEQSPQAEVAAQLGQILLTRQYAPEIFLAALKGIIREGWSWEAAMTMIRAAGMAPLTLLRTVVSRGTKAVVRRLRP